jgi:capsular exopolysaccharide synthesis family protein
MTKESQTIVNGTASADELLKEMRSNRALGQANESLLSSLTLSTPSGLPRSLMICSTQPEEGKTLVATMLALTAAMTGKQVLLVDGDLRRPRIHQIFGRDNRIGFGDYLAGTKQLDESMATLDISGGDASAAVRLNVMSSGARGSVDFNRVSRERFGEAVKQLSSKFELVVIDCPPVLAVNDALFLASVVEGVVFVVDAGAVSQHQAKLAKTRLEKAGAKMLGFVMNRLDDAQVSMSDQAYHRYYAAPDR